MDTLTLRAGPPAHGGACIARDDGRVVFVHYALPDELVEVEARGRRGGAAFAAATRVLEPSPDRVEPPCPHFGTCGGCHWQHARYSAQLELKRAATAETWQRAGLRLPPETPVLGMARPWRYRIRGEFEAAGPPGAVRFGLHRERSHSVLPLEVCPIHHERIEAGLLAFGQAVSELGLEHAQTLRLTAEPAGSGLLWDLRFRGQPRMRAPAELAARAAELLPGVALLDDSMSLEFLGFTFRVRSDTFVQTNHRQMLVLYEAALEMLVARPEESVLDLYSGIGTLSLAAARHAASVTSVEENPRAVQLGRLATRINGVQNVRFLVGRVESALKQARLGEHQAAILDPPRAGCAPEALSELLRLQPDRIVYVSCEPSTHARDLALLVRGGYRVRRAAVVDMFPQTYHVESVALLERASA
ncbi:MAG TPA: class I SAM-dependent RNA methyltransferase [Solirubrobacterales bacterium]|nr:class I SAM-dependent RNA methyltransferase [Solirubrobacterales bacterium]